MQRSSNKILEKFTINCNLPRSHTDTQCKITTNYNAWLGLAESFARIAVQWLTLSLYQFSFAFEGCPGRRQCEVQILQDIVQEIRYFVPLKYSV